MQPSPPSGHSGGAGGGRGRGRAAALPPVSPTINRVRLARGSEGGDGTEDPSGSVDRQYSAPLLPLLLHQGSAPASPLRPLAVPSHGGDGGGGSGGKTMAMGGKATVESLLRWSASSSTLPQQQSASAMGASLIGGGGGSSQMLHRGRTAI